MRVRPGTVEDIPALVTIGLRFIESVPVYREGFARNPEQLAETLARMVAWDEAVLLVAEDDGAIVGMFLAAITPHLFSGERVAGELAWWIEPSARGGGLRLLRAGEAWARGKGAKTLVISSPEPHDPAAYRRLGYGALERNYAKALS